MPRGTGIGTASPRLTASSGVYAFGFLFMLPQLFVNYKVRCAPSRRPRVPELPGRSRAHLPADEVGGAPALESLHLQGQPPAASARPCRPASVAAAGDGLGPSQASRQRVPEQGCSQRRGRASGGPSLGPGRQGHPCTGAGTTWPPRASAHGPGRASAPVLGVGTQSKCPSVSPAERPWPAAGCRAVGLGHQQPGWLPAPGGAPRGPPAQGPRPHARRRPQAFNTFIDDVFAFIITMPTSHRLACFRDDVVFLVYLYQRW